jgi:hypothetical protein
MSVFADGAEPKPRVKQASYLALLDDADQDRLRDDLTTFFGPRAEAYLAIYEKMRAAPPAKRVMTRSWSWPVLFGSFTWFFYRKMYGYGALLTLGPIIASYLFGGTGGGVLAILIVTWAKGWYVSYALNRVVKADKLGLIGTERSEYLQKAGGVSLTAGIFAGFIYACCVAAAIFAAFHRHKAGH